MAPKPGTSGDRVGGPVTGPCKLPRITRMAHSQCTAPRGCSFRSDLIHSGSPEKGTRQRRRRRILSTSRQRVRIRISAAATADLCQVMVLWHVAPVRAWPGSAMVCIDRPSCSCLCTDTLVDISLQTIIRGAMSPDIEYERKLDARNQLTVCVAMVTNEPWRRRSATGSGTFSGSCSGGAASGEVADESRRAHVPRKLTRHGRRSSRIMRCTS